MLSSNREVSPTSSKKLHPDVRGQRVHLIEENGDKIVFSIYQETKTVKQNDIRLDRLGKGAFGVAWKVHYKGQPVDRVVKITTDESEAAVVQLILERGFTNSHLVEFYDVVHTNEIGFPIWVIILQYVPYKLPEEASTDFYLAYKDAVHRYRQNFLDASVELEKGSREKSKHVLKEYYTYITGQKPWTKPIIAQLRGVSLALLNSLNVLWFDSHPGNFGFMEPLKRGSYGYSSIKVYDIGLATVLREAHALRMIDDAVLLKSLSNIRRLKADLI